MDIQRPWEILINLKNPFSQFFLVRMPSADYIDFEEKFPEILEYSEDRLKPYSHIHASSMGYCPRQRVLSKLGGTTSHEDNLAKMFKGSAIHKELQQHHFYDDPEMVAFEGGVEDSFTSDRDGRETVLTGSFDALDEFGNLYDFKVTSGLQYVEDEPQDHHVPQGQVYLNAIEPGDFGLDVEVDQLHFVYIQRWIDQTEGNESMPVVQHTVEKDEEFYEDVLKPRADGTRMLVEDLAEDYEDQGFISEEDIPPQCGCWLCGLEELDPDTVVF